MNHFTNHIIPENTTIREALVRLNTIGDVFLILFVTDIKGKMLGTITDGDIRRALILGANMEDTVITSIYKNFRFKRQNDFTLQQFKSYKDEGINLLPILDEENNIIGIKNLQELQSLLPIDVVIMAGGQGQRLRPLTENTPKPLLKVGDKPIIEHNIDRLVKFGIQNIYITLRYLGQQIEDYFGDGSSKNTSINYVTEVEELGTIGAVGLFKDFQNDAVLIMNSDLLTNIDYEDFYINFVETKTDMLVAAVPYSVKIPYAVLETEGSVVKRFAEKPTYTYHSNAGIYLIKREFLDRISGQSKYHATDFMQQLINEGCNVQTYPLMEYWLDIGRHEDFKKAQEAIRHIKL